MRGLERERPSTDAAINTYEFMHAEYEDAQNASVPTLSLSPGVPMGWNNDPDRVSVSVSVTLCQILIPSRMKTARM